MSRSPAANREPESAAATPGALKPVLGPFDATAIVIGAIIGVGIFFTPTQVATTAGSAGLALTAWIVGGVVALLGSLTFAELGGMYPKTGGQYRALRDAYGSLPAYLFVFCNSTAVLTGAAAIIGLICADNVQIVAGRDPHGQTSVILATVMLIGLAGANALGVRWGATIQNITVAAKLGTLALVVLLAVTSAPAEPAAAPVAATEAPNTFWLAALAAAMVPVLFSFGGWQHALWIGGEVKDPARNVPRAIVGGVIVVIVAYLGANWAYFALLGHEAVANSDALAADAVAVVWPDFGRRFVAGAVALSAFGVLNAQLLSGPRLLYAMATEGQFFPLFARVSKHRHTPLAAIGLIATIAGVLLWSVRRSGIGQLTTGVVLIDSVFFALTGAAMLVLRRKAAGVPRPVRVPGYPWVPILFVAAEFGIVIGSFLDDAVRGAAYVGVLWIAAAAVVYFTFGFGRQPPTEN